MVLDVCLVISLVEGKAWAHTVSVWDKAVCSRRESGDFHLRFGRQLLVHLNHLLQRNAASDRLLHFT